MRKIFLPLTLSLVLLACHQKKSIPYYNNTLWYKYPGKYWNSQGLHLGNGYFGATFLGGSGREVISLSEKSMWTGGPAMRNWEEAGVNPKARESLPAIRRAITGGHTRLADSLVVNDFFGDSKLYGYFTSIGDLIITFPGQDGEISEYKRELDLSRSIGRVQYMSGGARFEREYFCSYPDRILALAFSCNKPEKINLSFEFNILQDSSVSIIHGDTLTIKGRIDDNHRPFIVKMVVKKRGGTLTDTGGKLSVLKASRVEVFLTIATNYRMKYPDYTGEDPEKVTHKILQKTLSQDYDRIKEKHIKDYQSLYNRVMLNIMGNPEAEKLPTNERFINLKSGKPDPGYKVLAFNLGRYLIISSSRPGTLPANLQGVWNTFQEAPWAGNYQSNINLQEIYWSCGPVNLPECQQPYIDWIEDLSLSGREIARRCYGTGGWVSHAIGNIWGHAAPMGGIQWGMYPVGAAWHCRHVWEQYEFTQDMDYLKNQAYPILKGASEFWLENLVPFKGYLISAPTVSAEHGALRTDRGLNPAFHDLVSRNYEFDIPGVYQDIEMIYDLFFNTATAARLTGDNAFADSLDRTRLRLLPLKTGKYGQLQEWYEDIDNPDCHHRHIAHLYALFPGNQISPLKTPELALAAKKSLDMRGDGRYPDQELASGGNWARAYRMWCWTRLLDGNRADKIMTGLLTEQGFENVTTYQHADYSWQRPDLYKESYSLFCHFQLDASASLPGCIAEMLVQSHPGEIDLLPALPDELKTGTVHGLKARGGYTVDIDWENGKLILATIKVPSGKPAPVLRMDNQIVTVENNRSIRILFE